MNQFVPVSLHIWQKRKKSKFHASIEMIFLQEAIQYIQRQTYEEKLLNFVNTKFKFDDESSSEHAEDEVNIRTIKIDNLHAMCAKIMFKSNNLAL